MSDSQFIALAFLIASNCFSFLVMLFDKLRAVQGATERISEGMMFFLATIGGNIGVYLGMFAFHHKTKKWYFLIGIPFLIFQNLIIADYLVSLSRY